MFVEGGHDAKANDPGANLKFHREHRQRFVVQAGAEAAFAARMAGIAASGENDSAVLHGRVIGLELTDDGLATPDGAATHRHQANDTNREEPKGQVLMWPAGTTHLRKQVG